MLKKLLQHRHAPHPTPRPARGERGRCVAMAVLTLLALAPAAHAQTMADVARLSGPDRMATIIAGAKKEGALSLYSSAAPDDMAPIAAGFEKTYGLKIKLWRGSAEDIRNRAIAEHAAGRSEVDAIETAGPDLEAIRRDGVFEPLHSPVLADIIPEARRPQDEWALSRVSLYTSAFNPNTVRASEAPKSWDDLADPRWKGKLAIETEDSIWLMTIAGVLGEERTLDLFRRIVRTNGVSVRKGHTLLANLVVSGEVPFAMDVYGYKADALAHAGAPLTPLALPPLLALPTGVGVAKTAPHPFAAALFFEYLLTEGQRILLAQDNTPANVKVKAPPPGIHFLDPARALDEGDKWSGLFREIFVNQARAR